MDDTPQPSIPPNPLFHNYAAATPMIGSPPIIERVVRAYLGLASASLTQQNNRPPTDHEIAQAAIRLQMPPIRAPARYARIYPMQRVPGTPHPSRFSERLWLHPDPVRTDNMMGNREYTTWWNGQDPRAFERAKFVAELQITAMVNIHNEAIMMGVERDMALMKVSDLERELAKEKEARNDDVERTVQFGAHIMLRQAETINRLKEEVAQIGPLTEALKRCEKNVANQEDQIDKRLEELLREAREEIKKEYEQGNPSTSSQGQKRPSDSPMDGSTPKHPR